MRDLVQENIHDGLLLGPGEQLVPFDVLITVDHAADILHGAHIIVGDEDLVELGEGVVRGEELLIKVNAALRDEEILFLSFLNVLSDALSGIQLQRESVILDILLVRLTRHVRSGNARVKINTNLLRLTKFECGNSFTTKQFRVLASIHIKLRQLLRKFF